MFGPDLVTHHDGADSPLPQRASLAIEKRSQSQAGTGKCGWSLFSEDRYCVDLGLEEQSGGHVTQPTYSRGGRHVFVAKGWAFGQQLLPGGRGCSGLFSISALHLTQQRRLSAAADGTRRQQTQLFWRYLPPQHPY